MHKYSRRIKKPLPSLFHISFNDKLEGLWTPRPPDGDYDPVEDTVTFHGEPTSPRISMSPTLEGCFQGVYANVKHLIKRHVPFTFTIYQAVFTGRERIVYPETLSSGRLVHDAYITREHCVLDPVKMVRVGQCLIEAPEQFIDYWAFDDRAKGKPYGNLPVVKDRIAILPVDDARYREGPTSTFTHAGRQYSVDLALTISKNIPITQVPIEQLKWVLDLVTEVDEDRVLDAKVGAPLLVVDDPTYGYTVVDGTHRLIKLERMGLTKIGCKVIPLSLLNSALSQEALWATW